jgi:hypothetical protein
MGSKKTGGVAVDELRDDINRTRADLGDTTEALAGKTKSAGKTAGKMSLGALMAGLVAAAATIGAMRWRKSRQTPKNRAKRMWKDAKGKAKDVRKDMTSQARKMKSKLS